MKVLIIDDDERVRRTLRATIEERDGWEVEDQGFQNLHRALMRFRPDAIVLDLVEGDVTENENIAGNDSFGEIRRNWFCPVVVYSEHQGREDFEHDFVEIISKGRNSDIAVVQSLQSFTAVAQVIGDVHRDFDKRIREALHDSVPRLRAQIGPAADEPADTVLPRAVRRLVAARMDADASGGGELKAWERFVIPALGGHLLSADLLRREDADWICPDAFRLVLTPSCDLVRHGGKDPKAAQVLVAHCEPITKLGNVKVNAGAELSRDTRKKLKPLLTEGVVNGLLPIPRFVGHVPSMAANLKRLELVEWDEIRLETGGDHAAADGPVFVRAASTDSPFRELVVWAYLRVTGRPGAPAFDVEGWLDDISDTALGTGNREGN